MTDVLGSWEDGWGDVVAAFRRNFDCFGDIGAACCVYRDGRPVVDVWGGASDRSTGESWNGDTVVVVFSTTKGATAICAHMLAERGQLDLDLPVANYWPEFAGEGKAEIRVRWLLSHQAGLPGIDEPLTLEEACAWEPVIRALERARPQWEPGTRQGYHAATYGFLVGEVVRRVTGRTLGSYFADEVASPLGLDAWIGLPADVEPRVAQLIPYAAPLDRESMLDLLLSQVAGSVVVPDEAPDALLAMWTDPSTARLGGAFPPELVTEHGGFNARIVRASEHPGSGMVSDARSLARMYAATIGEVDGMRLLTPSTVEKMCAVQDALAHEDRDDLEAFFAKVFPTSLSLGFIRPTRTMPLFGAGSFGHGGAGGSLAFADPDTQVAFGYVMNQMKMDFRTANHLVAAVSGCVR